MRRKSTGEEHENADRWLLTYADMITLLMAFFIMMYSMSVLNVAKFRAAAISIRSGFGGQIKGQGKSILGTSGMFSASPSPIDGDTAGVTWKVLKPLTSFIEKDSKFKASTEIAVDQRGIVITMRSEPMIFGPGSARIREDVYPLLGKIAEVLDQFDNDIKVEGHTCNLAPRGKEYASNWELSTARATNVLRFLVEKKGLDPEQFSASGYASVHPSVPNTCEANRRRNRRVEIVVIPRNNQPVLPKRLPTNQPRVIHEEIGRRSN